jgi:hypothetical protein
MLFANNVHTKLNAFITNEHGRTGDQLLHFMLAFTAKRTKEGVFIGIT